MSARLEIGAGRGDADASPSDLEQLGFLALEGVVDRVDVALGDGVEFLLPARDVVFADLFRAVDVVLGGTRGAVAVPATAIAASVRARTSAGTASATPASTAAASSASSPPDGGSACRWRSVWRTTPIWVETWKPSSPRAPQTSSVEPPPMSITSRSVGSSGRPGRRRARVRERRLLVAGQRPPLEAVALAHRRGELGAVGGVPDRGRHHRGARLAAVLGDGGRVALERVEHALLRRVAEPSRGVDALAEPRHGGLADELA